ncbi:MULTISPECIES: hypothetical protein [Lachnospiraceae]|uniref:Uncharacterized protein n=1 Tax=Mediterraneibacter gnavus TaxID=33038 RepID=A0A3E4V0N2_MEDGN|nr:MULTISPECIES: hypothetical protein [Lachnospiraceae]MCB5620005.1 hypothetical protein [Mediterraneibacter gnavus]MCB5665274.1 hypothetical protein [Mediterraneibacter gnavus]MCB5682355.1 hypothetical protein [Mediterraneibacter gnavus]NSH69416.1 hypothetical protein [Mediterraneibacter gnavus]NSH79687.1 hypothetical protein [Mediterraneibacter gnavus]
MGWLLELLIEGIREICSQFLVDMMDLITGMFTDLLSCNLSLFEDLFTVVKDLYENAILPMGIAILLLILVWQLFKTMFGRGGVEAEDPVELVCRSFLCFFMLLFARPVANYILEVAGTPYQWVAGTEIEVKSFSDFVTSLDQASASLGIDGLSISILLLIMQFVVAWNYFKMLFIIAERYVLLGVFSYTAPLAFSTGGSKATNNVLASWSKMFGGQVVLIIMNAWCMKVFLSGYGNLTASHYGFTKFFIATLCLIGFTKVCFKMDSYMASLGVNLGRMSNGMGALGLMMAASRLFSFGHSSHSSSERMDGTEHTGTGSGETMGTASGMGDAAGPIPMSAGNPMDVEEMGEDYMEGRQQEEGYPDSTSDSATADTASEKENILAEMGITPEQEEMEKPEDHAENYGVGAVSEPIGKESIEETEAAQEQGNISDSPNNPLPNISDLEAETTGTNYAEGMLETDGIPVESENGEISNAEGAFDYPREEEPAASVGMELEPGSIGESEMDMEGVTSGSAGREYSAQESSGEMETSGAGILNEIGESSVPTSKGNSTISEFSQEAGQHLTGEPIVGENEFGQNVEGRISEAPITEGMEESHVAGSDMLLDGQNVREKAFPDEVERISKLEEEIPDIPKSRHELRRGYDNREY